MHGRRSLLFIAMGAVCVLAVAVAASVMLSSFRPEREIRRMLTAMSEVTTVSERSAVSWTREGEGRITTTLYATGQVNVADSSEVDHWTKFRLFRIAQEKDYVDLSGEIRTIDGTSYLTYAPPGPDVEGVAFAETDTWVSFESGERAQWGTVVPGLEAPVSLSGVGGEWTSEAIGRLRYLLARADIFVVSFDDLTELISGHATRVIDARFDPDALRSFLRDLIRAREDREPTTAERLAVEAQAEALEKLDVRLWIGIDDHLLYRVQAAGIFSDTTAFDLIVELSDFNAPFDGTVPESSLSFSDAYRLKFGAFMEDPSSKEEREFLPDEEDRLPTETTSTGADPDADGLSNVLESFYRTDSKDADTDDDGVSDGDEVLSGQNPRGNGTLFGFGLGE